ncbi:xanthine dehydrogenase [Acidithiobacillus thiooxidans]|uniref:XdhC family protein n=1 Tax=Acidithiobacillus thiooxidans TaxID=930 RepID=UPI001C068C1F|nr:XdhC family protein [Acidithiobacillus thiooxidans]MBU2749624.1 xanthine dehydrogenase [Acidithiobacillus thiooxidans]
MSALSALAQKPSLVTCEALVVDVKGSAPTAIGGSLALRGDDALLGTVGGGQMEYSVLNHLRGNDNWPARLEFVLGTKEDQCCGGRVAIALIDVPPFFSGLYDAGAARVYQVDERGFLHLIAGITQHGQRLGDSVAWNLLENIYYPGFSEDGAYFFLPSVQQQSVWVFGAGHVGRAFAKLAVGLDFRITVFDDRSDWAVPEAFPEEITLKKNCTPESFRELPHSDIVLIMTYSHAQDYALLEHFLNQPLTYLGVIASKSKCARFQNQLIRSGHQIPECLHMPMGLPGMGKKPSEIAVSILAELLQLRQKGAIPCQF